MADINKGVTKTPQRAKKIVTTVGNVKLTINSRHAYFQIYIEIAEIIITINVPVVFMARYVMILRGATSLRGALEGVSPENRDFFGP
jgi:hypothetical protein